MSKNARKLAIGTLLAGITGYITGILAAPKSGRETRADIGLAANKAKTEAERTLKQLHSELDGSVKEAKLKSAKLKAAAKEELDAAARTATEAREKARNLLSALHDGDAEDADLQKAIKEARKAASHLKKYLAKHGTVPKKTAR